jgi:hypothetical protein
MKEIKLTKGQICIVDDADFEYLNQFKWHAIKRHSTYYAYRTRGIAMHRQILGLTNTFTYTDHIDGNGLNNQRNNLRVATPAQNSSNRRSYSGSTSKYLGVSWGPGSNSWVARIGKHGEYKHIGCFKTQEEAALAYNNAAKEVHGEFANLNIIQ